MKKLIYILPFLVVALLSQCSVEEDPTQNPFVDGNDGSSTTDTVDPASLVGLHKYIFSVKCANPTCHDGSFEPDFRTVESTYQTLVYHPVIKNNETEDFTYRVLPGNHGDSWLYERLITTDDVIGRMPLYANPLTSEELGWVAQWIDDGARDANDNPSLFPNQPPSVQGFAIFDDQQNRIDTARINGTLSALALPPNVNATLFVLVEDDSTAVNDMLLREGKFSHDEFDFTNATVKVATPYVNVAHAITFNTSEFPSGDTIWLRYYVMDTDNPDVVEFPNDNSPFYFRIISSFVVQ